MATLSDEQIRFLKTQSVPLSRVFDASGMKRVNYRDAMRDLGMLVAIGVPPCNNGHRMKTRTGHCPQCKTHNIAFLRRHDEAGSVYVAGSQQGGFVKIGTAEDVQSRMITLNNFGYGGVSDWRDHYHIACDKAGKVEFLAQSLLQEHRTPRIYLKAGKPVDCQELFSCSTSDAKEAILMAASQIMPNKQLATFPKPKPEPIKQPNQKIPIKLKVPFYMRNLAELMGIKAHHVAQDLQKMKIYLRWDQEIDRHVAEKICKKRGFVLR